MLPVIIVGAGPTGLALALALAGHDVPSVVLDGSDGPPAPRPARSLVLAPDVARWSTLPGAHRESATWSAWRTVHRGREVEHHAFGPEDAPRHLPQHVLEATLREAVTRHELVRLIRGHRLTDFEQRDGDLLAHSVFRPTDGRREENRQWRGGYLVGCDGARSTVRKLLGVPFPGRTGVERYAVAALRTELPWPGEAGLHRGLSVGEVTVRPLTGGRWRLDWPLPPDEGLVTPEALLRRVAGTLTDWHDGEPPPYELLDTGVHICHQRLARSWRVDRVFLAGDAAHLLGALGTQQVTEGLRDAQNLAWKLAVASHLGATESLLDSYQTERRGAVGGRLRAVDQALPLVRGRGGLAGRLPGRGRSRAALLGDGHLGRGALGGPPEYVTGPLGTAATAAATTRVGARVTDVAVTALDGSRARLRDRLGGPLLLVLTAPGARVWDARHWLSAGLMPELAAVAETLGLPAELLVTEEYPGAGAHTVLLVRPDGHLAACLPGAHTELLREAVRHLRGVDRPAEPAGER
ncbi:FAD-dependent monooxygenase [Streptomyces sp. DSM 44915]|uniref:FAD-dependent monooxygenase n=1 Tax=Streptomyces chisholmiae TaxID=3075540 RepID=A0ABU2JMG0_9ACTN|nr:FAD-dependent monooxygenase [Streptomyces sp. DSM 44915]MDT0266159.1 FAD-dependent monooxygenase [Streptomyces sp. DSM 44915]